MLRKHGSRQIILLLTTLIASTLLSISPALGAKRTPPDSMPAGIDVAIVQSASASSEAAGQPAANAVDGDATTHWCPGAGATNAQLTVGLGQRYQLNGTGVTWVARVPQHSSVQISRDGRHWQQLAGSRSSAGALTVFNQADRHEESARFVRLSFSDSAGLPCVGALRAYASPHSAAQLIRGADLSTLRALNAAGKTFSDAGHTRPAEQILADHGMNLVRLRLWVQPPNNFN
jgi:hypothetical protein